MLIELLLVTVVQHTATKAEAKRAINDIHRSLKDLLPTTWEEEERKHHHGMH